jgi:hypothetical protein
MKKLFLLSFLLSSVVFASGSKMIKVDLDEKGTQIIKADLDIDDLYYYIDTNACICWVGKIMGGSNAISTFDCKNLLAYKKLEAYLSKCTGMVKPEVEQVVVIEEVKVEEQKKEDKKEEKKRDKKNSSKKEEPKEEVKVEEPKKEEPVVQTEKK